MINGKFFAGLPPNMIDRRGSGGDRNGKNRLESHLFWPDDTQAISATDMRLKRTSSKQNVIESSPLTSRQNQQQRDVDTRRMFHREFAKSSIQFNDSLEEEQQKCGLQKARLKSSATSLKQVPDDVGKVSKSADTNYMKAKRQQAYVSKIEFNDYAEDEVNKINNSKTRLNKNDKKQLEKNTKNSPKLQSKRNMKNLENVSITSNTKIMNDCGYSNRGEEECVEDQQKKMLTNIERVGNNKQRIHNTSNDNLDCVSPSEIMKRESRRFYANRNDPDEYHPGQSEYSVNTNSSDYGNIGLNYIQNNMKTLKIQSEGGRKEKQLYDHNNYDIEDYHLETDSGKYDKSDERKSMRQRGSYSGNSNIRNSPKRSLYPNDDAMVRGDEYEPYLESPSLRPTATPTHTNTYTNSRYNNCYDTDCNNDYIQENYHVQKRRGNTSRMLPNSTSSRTSDLHLMDPESLATLQPRNSSYASLSMMEGDDGPSPISNYRRTARNSATQRISVGLPD